MTGQLPTMKAYRGRFDRSTLSGLLWSDQHVVGIQLLPEAFNNQDEVARVRSVFPEAFITERQDDLYSGVH